MNTSNDAVTAKSLQGEPGLVSWSLLENTCFELFDQGPCQYNLDLRPVPIDYDYKSLIIIKHTFV